MKEFLIFGIFLFLIKNKKTTAKEIAKEFEISQRSVYRYIDALCLAGVPIITKLGRGGGIEVIGEFKLENMLLSFTDKEILKKFINENKLSNEVRHVLEKIIQT